jgi:hypothetical protein
MNWTLQPDPSRKFRLILALPCLAISVSFSSSSSSSVLLFLCVLCGLCVKSTRPASLGSLPSAQDRRHGDENPALVTPFNSAVYTTARHRDARNSFRIRSYENCRVSPTLFFFPAPLAAVTFQQIFSYHAFPHSLPETPGVGVRTPTFSLAVHSSPALVTAHTSFLQLLPYKQQRETFRHRASWRAHCASKTGRVE